VVITFDKSYSNKFESQWSLVQKIKFLNIISEEEFVNKIFNENKSSYPFQYIDNEEFCKTLDIPLTYSSKDIDRLNLSLPYNITEWYIYLRYCDICLQNNFHSILHQYSPLTYCVFHPNIKLKNKCNACSSKIEYMKYKDQRSIEPFICYRCKNKISSIDNKVISFNSISYTFVKNPIIEHIFRDKIENNCEKVSSYLIHYEFTSGYTFSKHASLEDLSNDLSLRKKYYFKTNRNIVLNDNTEVDFKILKPILKLLKLQIKKNHPECYKKWYKHNNHDCPFMRHYLLLEKVIYNFSRINGNYRSNLRVIPFYDGLYFYDLLRIFKNFFSKSYNWDIKTRVHSNKIKMIDYSVQNWINKHLFIHEFLEFYAVNLLLYLKKLNKNINFYEELFLEGFFWFEFDFENNSCHILKKTSIIDFIDYLLSEIKCN